MSLPGGWIIQTSKKTGLQYWFNTKTGASTYEEPPELKKYGPTQSHVPPVPVHSSVDSIVGSYTNQRVSENHHETEYDNRNDDLAQDNGENNSSSWLQIGAIYDDLLGAYESPDIVVFRDAIEILCQRLVASTDNVTVTKNVGSNESSYSHPDPCWVALPSSIDKHFRSIAHSLAEEFGLKTHSCILDEHNPHLKSLHIYSSMGCHIPPMVAAELEAEAILDREAELQRLREEEELIEAAKKMNASNPSSRKKNTKLDVTQIEAKKVEPLFAVRDKRSIGEIQDELLAAKRQKVR
jgi:hypothetical protein